MQEENPGMWLAQIHVRVNGGRGGGVADKKSTKCRKNVKYQSLNVVDFVKADIKHL